MIHPYEESAFQTTMISLISGLINEIAISIQLENDYLVAILPNFKNENDLLNEICAYARRNAFSAEIEVTDFNSILINKSPLKSIDDLMILGFDEKQSKLIKQNLAATIYLEGIYEQSKIQRPKILNILEEILNMKIDVSESQQPGILAQLFSLLPQREAFILSDTCGNIDGSTGNPLKNIMLGEIDNAILYHPISIAFEHGYSKLHLIEVNSSEIRSKGHIPERINFLKFELIPVNEYSFKVINKHSSSLTSNKSLNAFTLLSKRSFIPLHDDCQIKTSFPAQITSEIRTIDWIIACDVIHSNQIVEELAKNKLLPEHYWVLLTPYISQKTNDDRTTYCIRGGLRDAINNTQIKGIPDNFTPITACSLTSRNILTYNKTLLESMIEYGFDGLEIFKNISKTMIFIQLSLFKLGYIPDSHTQNVIYLFDFKKKMFGGVLNRDVECEKINLKNLRKYNLILPHESEINSKLLRDLSHGDQKLFSLYLHHTIYTKHIVPIANILSTKYNIDSNILCNYVKNCLIEWVKDNSDYDITQDLDLSGRYYERNLACKTLEIGKPPHYRLISNHPLLPQNPNIL